MKKILTIIVVGISILFITACNSNNENNVAIDVDDNTTTVIDTVVEMKDTTIKTIEDWIVYETIDFSLPLYKFADTKIHDTLLSIVNNQFGNDFDAVSIVYFPTVDTIGTYGKDSVPYLYNLYIGTINYYYYGGTWKSMLESIIGCSMIGDNLCYIEGDITLKRLFVKTSEKIHRTLILENTVCPCAELDAYCYLFDNDSLFFKSDLN